ncbi:MAG: hypothetical protein GY703_03800 [Gammaproteobacteria bacterium]|nr:hypothetical protein [Gammaproteobacteria bacterium]
MEQDTATIVAIVSVIVGALGFIFGVFTHFSTRKVAKLTYQVSQLSDFDVPPTFLQDLPRAPIAITVTSRGNKGTENIILNLAAISDIEEFDVSPKGTRVNIEGTSLSLSTDRLNPSQQIKLFLRCSGSLWDNQIEEFNLSHSEGAGQNERGISNLVFNLAGLEIEYDLQKLRPYVNRIGPLRLRSSE